MVTTCDLATYVGKTSFAVDDDLFAELVIQAATAAVDTLISEAVDVIPQSVRDVAILTVASELWHRRNQPGGIMQIGVDGTGVVRQSADALKSVRFLLAPYSVAI